MSENTVQHPTHSVAIVRHFLRQMWNASQAAAAGDLDRLCAGRPGHPDHQRQSEHRRSSLRRPGARRILQAARLFRDTGRHHPVYLAQPGVAVGFKSGLFNIGVEGQFYIGALARPGRAWHSTACRRSSICRWPCWRALGRRDLGRHPRFPQGPDRRARSHHHDHDELHRLPPDRIPGQRAAARSGGWPTADASGLTRRRALDLARHPAAAAGSVERAGGGLDCLALVVALLVRWYVPPLEERCALQAAQRRRMVYLGGGLAGRPARPSLCCRS